jgi:3-hydroxyacyl-[acyl-carrier protein] dehydratase/trans-2-decenoyl-[acyl-carrier protein] isomerase
MGSLKGKMRVVSERWTGAGIPAARRHDRRSTVELIDNVAAPAITGARMTDKSTLNQQNAYTYEDLLSCAHGELFGPGNARLPLPPMLMFDRISNITEDGGEYGKGEVVAELDIKPDLWFFACHFEGDPVMPGCLALDALWQLLGFYLGWLGLPGRGRAIGVGEVKLANMILPEAKKLTYHVNVKRVIRRKLNLAIADGIVRVDGEQSHIASSLRVGVFTSTEEQ